MRKRVVAGMVGATAVAVAAVLARTPRGRRLGRRLDRRLGARTLYAVGRLEGLGYRLAGGHPDPNATDDVLADRLRSTLGGLERRLDIPRVHVSVERHVAHLHGEVGSVADVAALERAANRVPGVHGVVSYLHVGLLPGDTRPSTGRGRAEPSRARLRLVAAVREAAGLDEEHATRLLRVILATFGERLPAGERRHVMGHLPDDVRSMAMRRRRFDTAVATIRNEGELDVAVAAAAAMPDLTAVRRATRAVLGVLRELTPEEVDDVAAVLPARLREVWVR